MQEDNNTVIWGKVCSVNVKILQGYLDTVATQYSYTSSAVMKLLQLIT